MAEPTDSLEHEARKDRTTYAAAMLLEAVSKEQDMLMKDVVEHAADLALKLERAVSKKLDEELKRGKK